MVVNNSERVVYSGKIFEVIQKPVRIAGKEIMFEKVRRSPGVRLLIINQNKILITKEYREEHGNFDYRLPGGKVFDSLQKYLSFVQEKRDILTAAMNAAQKECQEETGLIPLKLKHIYTTSPSATVQWDLFYFLIEEYKENHHGQKLEPGEQISLEWKTIAEVQEMCLNGTISEERTAMILLRFLSEKK